MRKNRFTLYCLEDSDEYFGDSIVDYFPPSLSTLTKPAAGRQRGQTISSQNQKVRGRLRLAGKGIFFEPDDWTKPIISLKFKDILRHECNEHLGLVTEEQFCRFMTGSCNMSQLAPSSDGSYLVLKCDNMSTQMIGGEYAPHTSETTTREHIFCFPFGGASKFVDKVTALLYVQRVSDGGLERKRLITQFLEFQERENPFGLSLLVSSDENILVKAFCFQIEPLTSERGCLVITDKRIYFKPTFPIKSICETLDLQVIRRVERRRYQFRETALEIATVDDQVWVFAFPMTTERDEIFHALVARPQLDRLRVNSTENMTRRWQEGKLSNFDYLMFLNWISGRSMKDLTQYPVLPWVLADYTSSSIDLSDATIFRDFSKPIGALSNQRLQSFISRANDLRSIGETPYLFGSHFSNPAYVTYYLVRKHPEFMLVLHSGKLDHGSRIFDSVHETFQGVLTGPTDLKELIPEFFFGNGDFLIGNKCPDLGTKGDGTRVHRDVILPPWAPDAQSFIRMHRMALESEYVSRNIHHWIDLIFGFQQDGSEAWSANNVFHPYSYESCLLSVSAQQDETKRAAMETHSREFGQMPKKLFFAPHPVRRCGATPINRIVLEHFAPPDSDELGSTPVNVSEAIDDPRVAIEVVAARTLTDEVRGSSDTIQDVQRLVTDALDLAHILELEDKAERARQTDSDQQPSSTDKGAIQALVYAGSVKCGGKGKLDSMVICQVPADADWMFEDYEDVVSVSMIFVGDSVGALHVIDGIKKKRLRMLTDFSQASICALVPLASGEEILLASLSGSLYSVDLLTCTCQTEYEDACGASSITALTATKSLAAAGSKTGSVVCWKLCHGVDTSNPVASFDVTSRVEYIDIDSLGKRMMTLQDGMITVTHLESGDAVHIELSAHVAKCAVLAFFTRDHMITVVGKYDVVHYTLDGAEWGAFATPCEVAVAASCRGGIFSMDSLLLCSPEGSVRIVTTATGAVIAQGEVGDEMSGATIVCAACGTELVALGDSAGRVHLLQPQ